MHKLGHTQRHIVLGCLVMLGAVAAGCGRAVPSVSSGATIVPPPPVVPPVPHLSVADAALAGPVVEALGAILSAQALPVATAGESYELPTLACHDLWVPVAPKGYACEFAYHTQARPTPTTVTVQDSAGSSLAEALFRTLHAAGATVREDPAHGAFMTLKAVTASPTTLQLDDYSTYAPPPSANVTVTGRPAQALLDALSAAAIDDRDGTLLLICDRFAGAPLCGLQLHGAAGPSLAAGPSAGLWDAVKAAAAAAGYVPLNGTLAQMTILNASDFTFDGVSLGFVLVADDSAPPPAPGR